MSIIISLSLGLGIGMGMSMGMGLLVMAGQLEQRASKEGPCEEALLGGADPRLQFESNLNNVTIMPG